MEENSRSKAYIKDLSCYVSISKVEIFKEDGILMIRDRITIPMTDRIKEIRNLKPMWTASMNGEKLVRPVLDRDGVIVVNNLTA